MKINLLIVAALAALFIWNPYPFQILELKSIDTLIMGREAVQDEDYTGRPNPRSSVSQF